MRSSRLLATFLGMALVVVLVPAASAAPTRGASVDVIVVLEGGVDARDAAADAARDHGFQLRHVYEHALRGYAGSVPEGRLNGLRNDPRVDYVERDQVATIAAQTVPTGIDRIFATGNSLLDIDGADDKRVDADVAVLDTGIDLEHPDLNVHASVSCFYSSGGPPHTRTYSCGAGGDDDHYHGTHVAGTVAALDNDFGVVGVAPGARLWAVKVLDSSGSGSMSVIIAGVDYVTANAGAIDVANMSLGCKCTSTALDDALGRSVDAGVTYAISAGNSDADTKDYSPAGHDKVITVSALADFNGLAGGRALPTCRTDQDDTLADFSNWGPDVDITAPGVCILSTYPLEKGEYATISGTSMSSPHVAGAAALLRASGTYTPAQVKTALQANGNDDWTDDSGDGIREKLLDVSNTTVFKPTMVDTGSTAPATPAPTGFDATAVSSSQIDLSWDFVDNETSYVLGFDNTGGSLTFPPGTTSHSDTGLAPSTAYSYTLTAVKDGVSSTIVRASATTLPADDGGGTSPTASFTHGCSDATCTFDGSPSTDGVTYAWSFGATTEVASTTFSSPGSYTISLTVTDAAGLSGSASTSLSCGWSGKGKTKFLVCS